MELVAYSDCDLGDNLDDRKSTSSNCFSLGSELITWSTKKQGPITLSSLEAKYIATALANAKASLEEIGEKQCHPTVIFF